MLKKSRLILTALFTGSLMLSFNTSATPVKISIPKQCQKLFQATEQLVAEAERQPGTHTQVSKIKNKLNQSKKQILEMELATQIKSCDRGLAKLNRLRQPEQQTN